MLSVEDKLRQLNRPVRVSTLSEICGISAATLRKKIQQGKIRRYQKSGVTLVEPHDFLSYWLRGKSAA